MVAAYRRHEARCKYAKKKYPDPAYFEPCLKDSSPDMLMEGNASCPLFAASGMTVKEEWDDFVLTERVMMRSAAGIAQFAFRVPGNGIYAACNLQVSPFAVSLTKYVTGEPSRRLGSYTVPGGKVDKWLDITLVAVGNTFKVSIGGTLVIDTRDDTNPLLKGRGFWDTCCADPLPTVEYESIVVRALGPQNLQAGAPVVAAITNGASSLLGTVSPGAIVTLSGTGLGPKALARFSLADAGKISTSLGGTRVLFDGVAAPLIYTQAEQVAAIVPFGARPDAAQVQVEYQGVLSAPYSTNGLIQVNLLVPASAPTGPAVPILLAIGNYVTQPSATVSIKPSEVASARERIGATAGRFPRSGRPGLSQRSPRRTQRSLPGSASGTRR